MTPTTPQHDRDELINDLADYHLRRLQEQHPIDTVETLGPVARDIATAQLTAYVAAIERRALHKVRLCLIGKYAGDPVRNALDEIDAQLRTTPEADNDR